MQNEVLYRDKAGNILYALKESDVRVWKITIPFVLVSAVQVQGSELRNIK